MAFDTIQPMCHKKEDEALHDFERMEADLMLTSMKHCNPCSFSTTKLSGSADRKTSNSGTRSKSFDSSTNERNSPRSVNSQTLMQQPSTDASMNKSCNSSGNSDSSAASTSSVSVSLSSNSSSVRIDGYESKRSFASTASTCSLSISIASSSSSVRTDISQESKRSFANCDS